MFQLASHSLEILKVTKVLTFNAAAELSLSPAGIVLSSMDTHLAPVETSFDATTERVSLTFAEELPAGANATLHLGFESKLTDSLMGYYKSTWDNGSYTLTQFAVRALFIRIDTSRSQSAKWNSDKI